MCHVTLFFRNFVTQWGDTAAAAGAAAIDSWLMPDCASMVRTSDHPTSAAFTPHRILRSLLDVESYLKKIGLTRGILNQSVYLQ